MIEAANLSAVTNLIGSTGAVSRYNAKSKPENCQGITDFNCEQMSVSGCKNHYEFDLRAEAKQKP